MKTSRICRVNVSSSGHYYSQSIKITRIVMHRYTQHGDNCISSFPADCVVLVYRFGMKTDQTEDSDTATVVIMLPHRVIAREKDRHHINHKYFVT